MNARARAIINPPEYSKMAEIYIAHAFKRVVFSVLPTVEGKCNDDILTTFVETVENMDDPTIVSSDISRFESNNHQGIKDVLIE